MKFDYVVSSDNKTSTQGFGIKISSKRSPILFNRWIIKYLSCKVSICPNMPQIAWKIKRFRGFKTIWSKIQHFTVQVQKFITLVSFNIFELLFLQMVLLDTLFTSYVRIESKFHTKKSRTAKYYGNLMLNKFFVHCVSILQNS